MIAIPNMEKPKSCFQCSFNDGIFCALIDNDTDAFIKNNPTEQSTKVLDDCPLIDIVTCGECKHYDFGLCSKLHLITSPENFCSDGERK